MRAIVCNGSPEELRQALPSDKWKRKAAVCKLDEELGLSLLFDACWWGRWDMADAGCRDTGHSGWDGWVPPRLGAPPSPAGCAPPRLGAETARK